jgi:hypothetical protein
VTRAFIGRIRRRGGLRPTAPEKRCCEENAAASSVGLLQRLCIGPHSPAASQRNANPTGLTGSPHRPETVFAREKSGPPWKGPHGSGVGRV